MTLDEYNGPYYKFGFRNGLLVSVVPWLGLALAAGALAYLFERRGEPETTPAPAKARGDIFVAVLSHAVYVLSIPLFWVIL